jgi:hypothetical protein
MGVGRQIAAIAISTESASIPRSALAVYRLSLLDWIAVALAG